MDIQVSIFSLTLKFVLFNPETIVSIEINFMIRLAVDMFIVHTLSYTFKIF